MTMPVRPRSASRGPYVSWLSLLTPIVRGAVPIVAVMLLAGVLTVAVTLMSPRKYRASVVLSTIFNPRTSITAGGLGALLGGGSAGGLQATPALIVLLGRQYGVLDRVAHAPMNPGSPETIGQRLRTLLKRDIPESELPLVLQQQFASGSDKQTGVITITAVSTDSAFARRLSNELVAEISRTFVRSSKLQASELRAAMSSRMDSASGQLRRAEESYQAFNSANRVVAPYSETALRRDQLERTRNLAQTIYTQAVTDRENAVARELEDTPAVVVLDSLPRELLREPRRTGIKAAGAALAAGVLVALLLALRAGTALADESDDLDAFASAVSRVPLVGGMLRRLLGLPVRRGQWDATPREVNPAR